MIQLPGQLLMYMEPGPRWLDHGFMPLALRVQLEPSYAVDSQQNCMQYKTVMTTTPARQTA
jgi:hypothetical protein